MSRTIAETACVGGSEGITRRAQAHAARGYERESAPYTRILRGCTRGERLRDSVPFHMLPRWVVLALGIGIGAAFAMPLGAAAKYCAPTVSK